MKNNSGAIRLRTAIVACVAGSFSLPLETYGADTELGIRVGASRTDNVYLVASPNEVDDVVYQASPWLTVVHESPTFDVNIDYRLDWFRYADLGTTSSYHRGDASVTGKVWGEALAVELGVTKMQALSDPDEVIPSGRLPLSQNLIDRNEWYVNPRLQKALGGAVALNMNFRYADGSYDDPLIQDDTNQFGTFSLDNYRAGQGLTWALRYDWRKTEYEISVPWEFQQATAELGFWASSTTRVFASGGKESAWDAPFDPSMTEPFWEAGVAYAAGEKITAEFAAGERSYGKSFRGSLDFAFRRGSTTLTYNESPTATGFNRSGGRRSVLDPNGLDDFLDRPGDAERYLSKRLQWDLRVDGRRTGFGLALFDEDRSGRVSADGAPRPDETQRGISANINWDVGIRTRLSASGSIIRRDTGRSPSSDFYRISANVGYRLGSRTELTLGYSYDEQQPTDSTSVGRNYVANIVSLFFTYTM